MNIPNDTDSDDELPPGWEERATLDGNVYYVNHFTKGSQWTHPMTGRKKMVGGELPGGWVKCVSDEGTIMFIDNENGMTTYTDPRLAYAAEYRAIAQPVRQRFDASSSALAVLHGLDLRGKYALITGANTGIGYETARSLAFQGCAVILACRDIGKAEAAATKIRNERVNISVKTLELDLASLMSVKNAANLIKQRYRKIDILILNAGVFGLPYTLTDDGYEATFQINHLSQYYLTLLLEAQLRNAESPRIVIVSSESHRFSSISDAKDIHPLSVSPPAYRYWQISAYNDSKLFNVLFAQELARRWKHANVFSCHPGNLVSSDLSRHHWLYRFLFAILRPFTKSLQQAASTSVYCASAPELEGASGAYLSNCFYCEPSQASLNTSLATRLWNVSQELILNAVQKDKVWYETALK